MKIVHVRDSVRVLKSKKEFQKEVPAKEPIYIVEMSTKEFQLVSFYLELENREPIMNVELKTQIKSNQRDSKGRFIKRS